MQQCVVCPVIARGPFVLDYIGNCSKHIKDYILTQIPEEYLQFRISDKVHFVIYLIEMMNIRIYLIEIGTIDKYNQLKISRVKNIYSSASIILFLILLCMYQKRDLIDVKKHNYIIKKCVNVFKIVCIFSEQNYFIFCVWYSQYKI